MMAQMLISQMKCFSLIIDPKHERAEILLNTAIIFSFTDTGSLQREGGRAGSMR